MLKKSSVFVFLGILAILALSAFSSAESLPVTRFGFSTGLSEFSASIPSNFAASGDETNFRIAHTWNGIFIPSLDVTGILDAPVSASGLKSPVVGSEGISRQYEYGPKLLAIGFLGVQKQYEYGPKLLATGFLGVQRQYEYGPALRATGFAALQ